MILLISSIKMFVSQRFDFERICFIKAKKHMQDPKVACACNRILQYVLSKSTHDRFEFLAAWMHLEYQIYVTKNSSRCCRISNI